jgi:Protein of unknown function (DUF2971)
MSATWATHRAILPMHDDATHDSGTPETSLLSLPPALRDAIKEFRCWRDDRKRHYTVDAKPLFHYTDAVGLSGIVQNGTLWFTHSDYLNDATEFHLSHDMANRELKRVQEYSADALSLCFIGQMREGLVKILPAVGKYVGSFSSRENDLSQWRSYADNGRGFCLCISERILTPPNLSEDPMKNTFAIKIKYDAAMADTEVKDGINKALQLLKYNSVQEACKDTPSIYKIFLCQLSIDLTHWIYFVSVAFKHPAYACEEEIRLLLINDATKLQPYVKTRVRGGNIIPYIPWPFQPPLCEILSSIRVGPSAPAGAEAAVTELLKCSGVASSPVVITRSEIPYRAT